MRQRHPQRALHLIDIENLLGEPRPVADSVRRARSAYETHVLVGEHDLVVVACNHGCALDVGLAYSDARLVVRSGHDGADLALLDVLSEHDLRDRFDAVVVASGDGIFAEAVAALGGMGLAALVVARPESLSRMLRLAAGGRVVAFDPNGQTTEPASAVAWAEAA
ncbi:MAG: NYN domain-containing protein [Actinomycetota bacterium]|nr:NYN domain-containing protein [Actinomycetota bacterium]